MSIKMPSPVISQGYSDVKKVAEAHIKKELGDTPFIIEANCNDVVYIHIYGEFEYRKHIMGLAEDGSYTLSYLIHTHQSERSMAIIDWKMFLSRAKDETIRDLIALAEEAWWGVSGYNSSIPWKKSKIYNKLQKITSNADKEVDDYLEYLKETGGDIIHVCPKCENWEYKTCEDCK